MRDTVRDYVSAVNTTYLNHVRHLPPAERGDLPLIAAPEITVIAAAARRLHLVATSDRLPAPLSPEIEVTDAHDTFQWKLRFFDSSVLPELGIVDDSPEEVRRILGIRNTVYHLAVDVGSGLTPHHAQHAGVALANLHLKTSRDLDKLRRALPRQLRTVDEFGVCVRLGLARAAALLVNDLTNGRVFPEPDATAEFCLDAALSDTIRQ